MAISVARTDSLWILLAPAGILGLALDSLVVITAGVVGFVILLAVWVLIGVRTIAATIRHRAIAGP